MNNLTRSIIEFIIEASRNDDKFSVFGKKKASESLRGKALMQTFIYITQSHGDIKIPDLHRTITLHALVDHVDWDEVAAFFSSHTARE